MKRLRQLQSVLQVCKGFDNPKVTLEQYPTPNALAAQILFAIQQDDEGIDDSQVLDLGCGCGVLSCAAVVMGATSCIGIDVDEDALKIAHSNFEALDALEFCQLYQGDLTGDFAHRWLQYCDFQDQKTDDESKKGKVMSFAELQASKQKRGGRGKRGRGKGKPRRTRQPKKQPKWKQQQESDSESSEEKEDGVEGGSSGRDDGEEEEDSTEEPFHPVSTLLSRLSEYEYLADVCICNPPFGTRNVGVDMWFLRVGVACVRSCMYSLHKTSTREHIIKTCNRWTRTAYRDGEPVKQRLNVSAVAQLAFTVPKMYRFHKDLERDIEVDLIRLAWQDDSGES